MKSVFLKPSDLLVKKISKEIPQRKINSQGVKNIAEKMLKIISEQQKKKKKGVGLAAPQIGIFKRIILVDTNADGKIRNKKPNLQIFINPEITWSSKRKAEWYEGCFSTGQICGIVSRSTSIKLKGYGKYNGYVARIFQHEIDHLNGKVFIERITDPNKLHKVLKKEFPLYRKTWKKWPRKYPLPPYKVTRYATPDTSQV